MKMCVCTLMTCSTTYHK